MVGRSSTFTRQENEASKSGARLLATALFAGIVTVLAIFVLFAVYQDYAGHKLKRQEVVKNLETVGAATAWGVDNWLMHRTRLAEGVADSVIHAIEESDPVEALKSDLYAETFIWTYFGGVGGDYHIWPHDIMPDGYDPRTRPWYHAALLASDATLTEPYFDVATGVETITVAAPVVQDGSLLGVVGADFSTETLRNVLQQTDLGGLGYAFLVAGDGEIIAHPDRGMVTKSLHHAFVGAPPEISDRVQFLDGLDQPQIVTFVRIPSLTSVDWYLGLSIDRKAAFASQSNFRKTVAIAALLASVLMVGVLGVVLHRLLVQPLNNARLSADAANVAKSEFLASMSHEIRTPMNGVLGMAEVLMSTDLDERQRDLGSIIVSSGNALMTVINDILDFSKLEAGKLRLSPQPFNIRQTIYDMATMMQARALEKDIEMIVRYDPNLPVGVIADESRIRQVLGNLIGNAVKFTEHGYVLIDVTGERDNDLVNLQISVKDTGIGIPDDQIPRMFEKFEQADGSHTRRFGGTGLGLAICKNIIELMDGDISAESDVGKGSRFSFSLSLSVDDSIKSTAQTDDSPLEGVRILAVDDNEVNRRILQELMDGWGLRAVIVSSPVQAMAALEKSDANRDPFNCIIADYQMPDEDGVSMAIKIHSDERFAALPVIVLSSIDDVLAGERVQESEIAAFLAKPVRPSQLMDTMARVLAESAPNALKDLHAKMERTTEPVETKEPVSDVTPTNRTKLLVAEDNIVNQMVINKFIDEHQYEVIIADNGEKAVEAFIKHRPALVFMDLSMPVLDGFEATRRIRELERNDNLEPVPIIATTAHVLDEDRKRCLDIGMDSFLAKPIKKASVEKTLVGWLPEQNSKRKFSAA